MKIFQLSENVKENIQMFFFNMYTTATGKSMFLVEPCSSEYLIVREEALGSGELSSCASGPGRRVQTVHVSVIQREGLAVHGHAQYDLALGGTLLQPVADCEVLGRARI